MNCWHISGSTQWPLLHLLWSPGRWAPSDVCSPASPWEPACCQWWRGPPPAQWWTTSGYTRIADAAGIINVRTLHRNSCDYTKATLIWCRNASCYTCTRIAKFHLLGICPTNSDQTANIQAVQRSSDIFFSQNVIFSVIFVQISNLCSLTFDFVYWDPYIPNKRKISN